MKENAFTMELSVNNATIGNGQAEPQRMTSLEIAELTGKQHKNVMRDIRNMEPAWEKVTGLRFEHCEKAYLMANGVEKLQPYYLLTKTETLYIATKYNDEARARLVIRWEQLERERLGGLCPAATGDGQGCREVSLMPSPEKILRMADSIIGAALSKLNAAAEDTLTATQVAKTFNMTVFDFNRVLSDMGIQYRRHGHWNISDDLTDRNLVRERTYVSYSLKGEKRVRTYMTWTLQGLRYLNSKLGYPNF